MRKAFVALGVLTLTACAWQGGPPPQEVLARSAQAQSQLRSSRFQLHADMHHQTGTQVLWVLNADLRGSERDNGAALELSGECVGNAQTADGRSTLRWSGSLISLAPDIYLRTTQGSPQAFGLLLPWNITDMPVGEWLELQQKNGKPLFTAQMQDPTALLMQSRSLRVVKDEGKETLRGMQTYVYDVSENRGVVPGAPQTMDGRVWIDSKTFLVQRIAWHIAGSIDGTEADDTLQFDVFDQDSDIRITAPQGAQIWQMRTSKPSTGTGTQKQTVQ